MKTSGFPSNVVRVVVLITLFFSTACSQPINRTTGGAIAGTAVGSGLGAIIGSASGRAGAGTAIGAGVGAITGTLIGSMMDSSDAESERVRRRVELTNADIAENQRLLDELRARGADARMTSRGVSIHLPDILFDFNRANLNRGSVAAVADIAEVVRKDARGREILVEGHTDSVGSDGYNRELSARRADTVARELIANGANRSLVRSKGYGEGRPLASNESESGRSRNRRVEVVIAN